MFSSVRNKKNFRLFIWIGVLLFGLPAIVYAASYILNSGEFVGLGAADGRITFFERGTTDEISISDSNVGINVAYPGQKLHVGDGNVLIEGGGETSIQFKRDVTYSGGPSGNSVNPIFHLGRIIQAGDGDPEFRVLYSDDNTVGEHAVFEFDRKGIVASVKTDRGSHFEGFIATDDPEPIFRLNSYPTMRLEMGAGGSTPVDVAIERKSANTMTLLTGGVERARIDSNGLAVVDGYVKLDTNSGAPPATDCDQADEIGRMKVDTVNPFLYICTATGWGKMVIGSNDLFLPVVEKP